jgi:phosphoserine phosphatase RsbU/P
VKPFDPYALDTDTPKDPLTVLRQLREYEIDEARSLQLAIVPAEPLRAPPVEIASRVRPVTEVGGDFLDYFLMPDGRVGFYLGDVVGKGLPAALYAALAVGTLRGFNKRKETPSSILSHFNERIRVHNLPGRFCAVQYGVFDPRTFELTFSNAALPLPVHVSRMDSRPLGDGGLPSGLFEDPVYENFSIQLHSGESVVFITDGILEACNPGNEEFGLERILEACASNSKFSAPEQLSRLLDAVDRFVESAHPQDDMTVLVLKVE